MNELLSVRSVTYLVSVFPLMWFINLFDVVCAGAGRGWPDVGHGLWATDHEDTVGHSARQTDRNDQVSWVDCTHIADRLTLCLVQCNMASWCAETGWVLPQEAIPGLRWVSRPEGELREVECVRTDLVLCALRLAIWWNKLLSFWTILRKKIE